MYNSYSGGRKWGGKDSKERRSTGKWVWRAKNTQEKDNTSSIPGEDGNTMLKEQISLLHLDSWKLPKDVTFDIFSRLSVKVVMRCRCVSKTWRSWISNPVFVSLHLARALQDSDRSLLVTTGSSTSGRVVEDGRTYPSIRFNFEVHIVESTRGLVMGNCSIPRIEAPFRIRAASCNGLLCSPGSDGKTVVICNPFTRETLELSNPGRRVEINRYVAFGYHPRTKEYKVLYFTFVRRSKKACKSLLEVQTLGSSSWRSKGEVRMSLFYQPFNVLVNGALHWLAYLPNRSTGVVISSFDIGDEEFRVLKVPAVVDQWERQQVFELDGLLSLVGFSSRRELVEIWIMSNYGAEDSWSKQFVVSLPEVVESVQLILKLDGGKILIQYNESFVTYDPNNNQIKRLPVQAPQGIRHCVAHAGSLLSPRMKL